jgi:hypothetical protein
MATRGPPGARGMNNRFAQFKLVLLGESAVGKSSIVLRFVKDQFDSYRESTIGAAFLTQTISLDENTTVKFEIWDTAGQERYKSLAPMYYRNANCAVVVYDITQAVRPLSTSSTSSLLTELDITRQGQVVGQGATEASQRKHHYRARREQAGFGDRAARQASNRDGGRRGLREGGRSSFLRDIGKDGRERAGAFYCHRQEVAA